MLIAAVAVPATAGAPAQVLAKGAVVEMSAATVTALACASSLRAVASATMHDTLGEAFAVSNSD